jgi:plastocyanin
VTWTNDDNQLHTVTAVDGSFDSGFLEVGASFSYTFTEVGDFEYFCLPHPWMRARVVVEP